MTHDEFTVLAADCKLRRALLELRGALLARLILGNVDTETAEHATMLIAHLTELLERHYTPEDNVSVGELETGGRL